MVNWQDYIGSDPNVLLGKPCIKGTRLSVEFIVKLWASEWTEEMILKNYPGLTKVHLSAVAGFIHFLFENKKVKLSQKIFDSHGRTTKN